MLAEFIEKIHRNHPAELAPKAYGCSMRMITAIRDILTNKHSPAAKARLLQSSIDILLKLADTLETDLATLLLRKK